MEDNIESDASRRHKIIINEHSHIPIASDAPSPKTAEETTDGNGSERPDTPTVDTQDLSMCLESLNITEMPDAPVGLPSIGDIDSGTIFHEDTSSSANGILYQDVVGQSSAEATTMETVSKVHVTSSSESTATLKCSRDGGSVTETPNTTPTYSPTRLDSAGRTPPASAAAAAISRCSSKAEQRRQAARAATATLVCRNKPMSKECSLVSCLHQFTAQELLSGNNMLACSVCNRRANKTNEGKTVNYLKKMYCRFQ